MTIPRPAGIECTKWEPESQGSKRCRYYIPPGELSVEGMCKLPSEMLCVEWVRKSGSDEQKSQLLGIRLPPPPSTQPIDPDAPPPLELQVQQQPPRPPAVVHTPQGEVRMAPPRPFEPAKEIDASSLEALELAGVEVELSAPHLDGGITLVPARTGRSDRSELTFREASVLRMLVDCFPGAHVTAYRAKVAARTTGPRADAFGGGVSMDGDEVWTKALEQTCPGCGAKSRPIRMPDGSIIGTTPGPGPDGKCTACGAAKGEPLAGTRCSVCHEPQRATPGGFSCINGHGGADSIVEVDPWS
jgi:hypothetical protein